MRKLLASLVAVLVAAFASAQAPAKAPAPASATPAPIEVDNTGTPGKATARRTAQATATITAIDAAARTVTLKGTSGELTGGPDGRLFTYEATSGQLSEIALGGGYAKQPITTLSNIAGASGWALSRYGGVFYIFTRGGMATSSQCSTYDPASNAFGVRDASVGFTVVGAGQSTCVPPPVPK